MIQISMSSMVEIRILDDKLGCTLRFQEDTGLVIITFRDLGRGISYHWPAKGRTSSLGYLLHSIEMEDAAKCFMDNPFEINYIETYKNVIKRILSLRRAKEWDAYLARKEYHLASNILSRYEFEFDQWYHNTRTLNINDDLIVRQIVPGWRKFWDETWVPRIVPVLSFWPEDIEEALEFEHGLSRRRRR